MIILGISSDFHDSAAALIVDGEIVAAHTEERLSRVKHDPRFPVRAIRACCAEAGIRPGDIDRLAYFEDPLLKLERVRRQQAGHPRFAATVARWLAEDRFDAARRYATAFRCQKPDLHLGAHHRSHAASAFLCGPFESAAVVTLDGVGELETMTIWQGRGTTLSKVAACHYPHSLGLVYSAFTAFLGFEVNEGEYKVMGMAGFGQPTLTDEILGVFDLKPDGSFAVRPDWFNFADPDRPMFTDALCRRFGRPRPAEDESLAVHAFEGGPTPDWSYADIAASLQRASEEVILHVVARAMAITGERNVCLAGGVALNGLANDRLQKELGCRLFVQPAAGDAGCALGAALDAAVAAGGGRVRFPGCYLGGAIGADDLAPVVQLWPGRTTRFADADALVEEVAGRLADGQIVGWAQGRSEWGPRALGNRSILAAPLKAETKDLVNAKIKFREGFRPFAPSVAEAAAAEYFDIAPALTDLAPERYMTTVARVRDDKRGAIPAVTHVDGTARPQVVGPAANPLYHALIARFGALTGVPVLLNTSFNRRGEPIVETAEDAVATFRGTDLDALVINDTMFEK